MRPVSVFIIIDRKAKVKLVAAVVGKKAFKVNQVRKHSALKLYKHIEDSDEIKQGNKYDFTSSFIVTTADTIYLGDGGRGLIALERSTGCERWVFEHEGEFSTAILPARIKAQDALVDDLWPATDVDGP